MEADIAIMVKWKATVVNGLGGNIMASFLQQPPKIRPLTAFVLGAVCIPTGLLVQGPVGGALIGGGVGAVLMSAWDSFRMWMGWIDLPGARMFPEIPQQIEWLEPWQPLKDGGEGFAMELQKELPRQHVLHGVPVIAVARRIDCDDVLFATADSSKPLPWSIWRGLAALNLMGNCRGR